MLAIRKILVPVDFSSRSGPAYEHGIAIAKQFGAEVTCLHVIPAIPPDASLAGGYPGALPPAPGDEKRIREVLAEFLERTAPGFPCEILIIHGDVAEVIQDVAKDREMDLIVMPTHGRGGLRRLLLGSVTTKVLETCPRPVLTGAHVEHVSTFAATPYRKVACSIDLGEGSASVVRQAGDFAAAYGADLIAIHAISAFAEPDLPSVDSDGKSLDSIEARAEAATAAIVEAAGVTATSMAQFGAADELVPKILEAAQMDLLVVGRNLGENGSHAHVYDLVRKSPCPVLSL